MAERRSSAKLLVSLSQGGAPDKDQVWQDLINDRSAYWDMRGRKTNPKAPDFKHKSTGDVRGPSWAPVLH